MPADPAPHTRGRDSEPGIVELCETHARMPVDIARWTSAGLPDHVTPDDLAPAAWEGLYDAAATWRPDLGPFKPWARVKIRAAIIADLRATDPQSKSWRARDNAIDRARYDLTGRLGRTPTDAETAHAAGITLDALDRHRRARIRTTPLDDADLHADGVDLRHAGRVDAEDARDGRRCLPAPVEAADDAALPVGEGDDGGSHPPREVGVFGG